ncbi:oxidoreductase [Kutzneria sp. 744]|uniref:oxidoreductase n=1 Tax=Kutzneria sp. (strain 744) TaxID=345341 RepID=UPI0003EEE1CA|nr:oxidoreductase [Kutzneria sp. 744]EWM12321.1 short-chain dehydrogenase [Kutzneria sp. 744]
MRTWFVTGASRGFGFEIARQALEQGDNVVATARRPEEIGAALTSDRLLALPLDVTDEAAAQRVVDAAVDRFGGIDVLVNNAGRGLLGAVEEASDAEVRAVYDTNVFGLLAVTRAVLPVLRRQRAGRVINISSIGGFASSQGWGIYNSTKFAVEGLSEALRIELAPLGIDVTIVEPGMFRTRQAIQRSLDGSSLHTAGTVIEDYADTAGQTRGRPAEYNQRQQGDPAKAAAAIITVATAEKPPLRVQLGADSVARVEAKLAQVADELAQWRDLAVSTAYEEQ